MMIKEQIRVYLEKLNDELSLMGVKGEVCLYGGAVMCLVYDARPSTKDVDAIFKPVGKIREAIKRVANEFQLREDWLNDAVKGFIVKHPYKIFISFSNLEIYAPDPDYLLAMKSMALRVDSTDKQAIQFLIRLMELKSANEVFDILEKYYPRNQIKPAAQFFIEELFGQ